MRSGLVGALAALSMTAVGAANAQVIGIVTTPAGSFTNSIGAAVAKVIVEHGKLRATVTPQQSHGQEAVHDGSAELSLASLSDVQQYVTGTVDWAGKGEHKNIRIISRLIPIRTAGFVRKDSPIKSLAEIKGKRISWGFGSQKAVQRVVEAQLAIAGLTGDDVQKVLSPNIVAAADDFIANKTDVFWFATGSAKVKQASASVGGIRALPITDKPDAVRAMHKHVPGSYPTVLNPAPPLDGIIEPTMVMAYDVVLFTNVNVKEDVVYRITKAVHENKTDMAGVFRPMAGFEPNRMATEYDDLRYHPGAIKYFKEIGQWPPKRNPGT
ncbi:MAG: TAXI family TRAP transporter solute-binding subunit [Rhizobiales bacterium]|nr:TAXI family TRAP transporter solute-binding subunit [Hyphomicrobiales bacterium]